MERSDALLYLLFFYGLDKIQENSVTQSANSEAKASRNKSNGRQPWLLVLIFRLLLLGVGGGLSLILGIIFANFYPNPNPERPLLLKVLERLDKKTPVLPANASPIVVPESSNPPPQLAPPQKQQAQAELTKLQGQMKQLSDEVAALETQLGSSRPNEGLEARLQALGLQLEGVPSPNSNAKSVENSDVNQATTLSAAVIQADKLKVTLPSDLLFEESNSLLRSEAGLILDKIVTDLRNYPASTIRIAAHTDATQEAEANRELSFRRAKAVEQYFANALGKQYRWLTVGYGETRPLVPNDTVPNQQRNRRVEIAVD
ncbi:MAG TPA: OmpA family protein [Candidatus Sericytochromatia bacterium]|jgi:outer membrane protein OmpA-like peptidoglycan-associated protein